VLPSLAAFQCAIDSLNNDQCDAVLTGGVDRNMGPDGFVKFCKIGCAQSRWIEALCRWRQWIRDGRRGSHLPVEAPWRTPERDGDRIYAVIRGIGGSSDGKGKRDHGSQLPGPDASHRTRLEERRTLPRHSLSESKAMAPRPRWATLLKLPSLNNVYKEFNLPVGKIALGSVKSNIGHLKAAAGAVALLKALYALHDRILPPSINFERPNSQIDFNTLLSG